VAKGFWGNASGPDAKMYAYVEMRTTAQEEGRAWVQYKRSVYVDSGNFNGTIASRSWGGQVRLYGTDWYGDSGWQDYGWVGYGGSARVSASVWYTGWSGTYYNSSVDARYSPDVPTWKPNNVMSQVAVRRSDGTVLVTWRSNTTDARPYDGVYVDVSVDDGEYELAEDCGGDVTAYTYQAEPNRLYKFRVLPHNSAGNAPAHQYTNAVATTPNAPKSASVARDSDTQNTLRIVPGSPCAGLYLAHDVQRQMDGGAWSDFGAIEAAGSTKVDRSTSANHSWRYRVRSRNAAGASAWVETGTVYNTPCAPGKPKMSRVSDTKVKGAFENGANTATGTEIERSPDLEMWTAVRTTQGKATDFEDDPGGGTWYYRVRNVCGDLASAWVESDGIVTICAPAAPTITSPSSSQVIPKTQASITVAWRHNPIDGSAQTAAQWRYSTDGGKTWNTLTMSGAASSAALANSFAVNAKLTVQARTKGAHADYSPWSAAVSTYVRQVPTVTIEEPGNGFTIENTPVHVRIAYSDPSGAMAAGTLTVRDADGAAVYSRDLMGGLEFDVPAGEWLPSDGASYALAVTVRSSSTLQGSAARSVSVKYVLPSVAIADAAPDPETGYVAVTVREGRTDAAVAMESCSLWRNVDGARTLLAEGLLDGSKVVDRYAPLNTDYSYETASFADSGAVSEASFPGRFESARLFVYWSGGVASGMYNASDSFSVKPSFDTFEIAGRGLPVAVAREYVEEPHDVAVKLRSREEAMAFYRAVRSCEPMVFKTLYGFVFHGMASAKFEPSLGDAEGSWEVSLDVTRIWGEAL
jgi:hypothetical protein